VLAVEHPGNTEAIGEHAEALGFGNVFSSAIPGHMRGSGSAFVGEDDFDLAAQKFFVEFEGFFAVFVE
jgi:hypothetical protein